MANGVLWQGQRQVDQLGFIEQIDVEICSWVGKFLCAHQNSICPVVYGGGIIGWGKLFGFLYKGGASEVFVQKPLE